MQGIPNIRQNLECGFDINNIASGREPCQMGWYEWIGKNYCIGKTVLDVGAGMCDGMKLLKSLGTKEVHGQDIDTRLNNLDNNLFIQDVDKFKDKSYDIITCFDVVEHVIEDLDFFNHLLRIAKEKIFITTPNFSRSKAQNHCHCREYTIPQFANTFLPNELWSASPDGKIHHTKLLEKINNNYNQYFYLDKTRNDKAYDLPIDNDLTFTHSTVDGQEWPHICGIFDIKN